MLQDREDGVCDLRVDATVMRPPSLLASATMTKLNFKLSVRPTHATRSHRAERGLGYPIVTIRTGSIFKKQGEKYDMVLKGPETKHVACV
jgi:hypothetical protein